MEVSSNVISLASLNKNPVVFVLDYMSLELITF